jgi:hypothetical protein
MNTHDLSDIFICMNCGVGFDNMTEQLIIEHKTTHEKKLFPVNIQCDVCDEHFTELGLLLVHKKMDTIALQVLQCQSHPLDFVLLLCFFSPSKSTRKCLLK